MFMFKIMVLVMGALAVLVMDIRKDTRRENSFIGWTQVIDKSGKPTCVWEPEENSTRQ